MKNWGDISYLFNGLGNNVSNSINYNDYASIKSGSYKKLLKAYYAEQKGTTSKTDTTSKKDKTASTTDTTGLAKMKAEATELKESANQLADNSLWKNADDDREKIVSKVESFVNNYNDVVGQKGKLSSSDVDSEYKWMTSMTSTMSNALSKIGITVNSDNTLKVDKEALADADIKNMKSLFKGTTSYAGQIAEKAGQIASAATKSSSIYSSNATLTSSLAGIFNQSV